LRNNKPAEFSEEFVMLDQG